jgi:hypothetical protein
MSPHWCYLSSVFLRRSVFVYESSCFYLPSSFWWSLRQCPRIGAIFRACSCVVLFSSMRVRAVCRAPSLRSSSLRSSSLRSVRPCVVLRRRAPSLSVSSGWSSAKAGWWISRALGSVRTGTIKSLWGGENLPCGGRTGDYARVRPSSATGGAPVPASPSPAPPKAGQNQEKSFGRDYLAIKPLPSRFASSRPCRLYAVTVGLPPPLIKCAPGVRLRAMPGALLFPPPRGPRGPLVWRYCAPATGAHNIRHRLRAEAGALALSLLRRQAPALGAGVPAPFFRAVGRLGALFFGGGSGLSARHMLLFSPFAFVVRFRCFVAEKRENGKNKKGATPAPLFAFCLFVPSSLRRSKVHAFNFRFYSSGHSPEAVGVMR